MTDLATLDLTRAPESKELSVGDLSAFLRNFAASLSDPRTGNLALSAALNELAAVLRRYNNLPVTGLKEALASQSRQTRRDGANKRAIVDLPPNIDSLDLKSLDLIIASSAYSKAQLMELGTRRFGIARARLTRLSRPRVVEIIRAAMDHERSLQVISEEARRGGVARSS